MTLGPAPTVEVMRCVECAREKAPDERGWMTVLSPSGSLRIHYCPDCVADLVQRASAGGLVEHRADDAG
jgi:hypothetical protein